ncbi:MAG TPA: type II toxin-antitoxin system Phd/YefM family antitoxin [Chloroflexota bacterium]|jgi:prevent-host-death family protein|nr:type II toxin-antitoxin system Phd/YefM family antitoxin [Chloroflexota bacterium]
MTKRVSAAHAKAHLSELVSRVAHSGERYVIERHGRPAAALVSLDDLAKIEPPPGAPADDPLLRHLGAWGDLVSDQEIDRMVELIYAERERNVEPRPDLGD